MAKILIVDDVKAIREVLNAAVKSMGHEASMCSSSAEAIKTLNGPVGFDLVLLDIGLEDGDGIAILKLIKHGSQKSIPKVCFISGSRDRETIMRAIAAGGDGYLVKPIDPKSFKEKVSSLLGADSGSKEVIFEVEADLKANLFESPVALTMRLVKASTKEFLLTVNVPFEQGKVIDVVVPTLGNLCGYKGTFRGQVASVKKIKEGLFQAVIALQPLVGANVHERLVALCGKGEKLVEPDEKAQIASVVNIKAPPKKPIVKDDTPSLSSLALAALTGMNKR